MIYLDSSQTLEDLFKVHGAYVFNLALSITKKHHLAEDVAQEVFIKFLEKDIVFRNKDPRHLLSRMTYNRALDALKSQKTRHQYESAIPEKIQPEVSFETSDDQAVIREVLKGLEDELRIPLTMRFIGGSKFQEISRELNLPISTIQRRIEKGLTLMRLELKQKGFGALVPLLEDFLRFEDVTVTYTDTFVEQFEQAIASQKVSTLATGATKFKASVWTKTVIISLFVVSSVGVSSLALDKDFKWERPLESLAQFVDFSNSTRGLQQWIGDQLSFVKPFRDKKSSHLGQGKDSQEDQHDHDAHPNRSKNWEGAEDVHSTGILDQDFGSQNGTRKTSSKKSDSKSSKDSSVTDPSSSPSSGKASGSKKTKAQIYDPTKLLLDQDGEEVDNSEVQSDQEEQDTQTQEATDEEDAPEEGAGEEDQGEEEGSGEDDEGEEESDEDQPDGGQDEGDQEPPGGPEDGNGGDEPDSPPLPESLKFTFNITSNDLDPNDPGIHAQIYGSQGLFQPYAISKSMAGVFADKPCNYSMISSNGQFVTFTSYATNLVVSQMSGSVPHIYIKNLVDGSIVHASMSSNGKHANQLSGNPSISADGRYVSFFSNATNLDPEATDGTWNIYLYDQLSKKTVLVNRHEGQNGARIHLPFLHSITSTKILSASGQFIVFAVLEKIYVRDVINYTTQIVDMPDFKSRYPVISADGRYIAFFSSSNFSSQYFLKVRDLQEGSTHIAAKNISGNPVDFGFADPNKFYISISDDGQKICFRSDAGDLVPNDTNNAFDVFVSHWSSGQIERVSVSNSGLEANKASTSSKISGNGRYVIFHSTATNLTSDQIGGVVAHIYIRDLQQNSTSLVSKKGNQLINAQSIGMSISN